MNGYIRTNSNEVAVLDYDELDTGARANLIGDMEALAADLFANDAYIALFSSEPEASNAEKVEAVDGVADAAVRAAFNYSTADDGSEVEVDGDTLQMCIDIVARDLYARLNLEV